jgi:rod shape-determining protein MreC
VFRHNNKNLVYVFILALPFFLFLIRPQSFSALKFKVVNIISIPIRLLSFPLREAKKVLYYHRTFEEYKRLKQEVDVLKVRLIGQEEVLQENARLEKLLDFKRKLLYSSVPASVVGRDPSLWNASMILDKGFKDGIRPGQPVVNALGVVGKIAEVSDDKSKVMLLTDPRFSVAALVQRRRESGLVMGTLMGTNRMRYINEGADIKVGDKVITSKLSTSFPESLMIGEVVQVTESLRNASTECIIRPAVSLSQVEEVLIIIK